MNTGINHKNDWALMYAARQESVAKISMSDFDFNSSGQDDKNAIVKPFLIRELCTLSNPESLLLEKEQEQIVSDGYSSLSDEAKQCINMIFNAPAEILDMISSPKTKKISKNKIFAMMKKQWKDRRAAQKVINELDEFVKTFGEE